MELQKAFDDAQNRVNQLTERPSDTDLLQLYGLYKQATEGDVTAERPGGFDFKAQFKYDAWKKLAGMEQNDAMERYIALVNQLSA